MEDILESIGDAIHEFFVDVCGGMFLGIFDDANAATGDIARQVGLTPSQWNGSIFNMIQNLSNNVVVPIAGMIITFVLCYELITTITEKNNMHDVDTFIFFKYVFKACVAVFLLSHTFEITMAIFDVGQWIVNQAATSITNDTFVDVTSVYIQFRDSLDALGTGELIALMLEVAVVSLAVKAIAILVSVVLINRMIEIYLYCSIAPIPFATMTNREWGNIGTNYIRSLLSLAFQGLFIMVIVGIYSALVKDILIVTNLHLMLMRIAMYSIVLCLTLFKTSSISKSIFNAH
ncbi:MAG: hypothetical protein IKB12_07225 [Clostridia bacterium]|nr:hypothetical protein [Clostridia bacterium]